MPRYVHDLKLLDEEKSWELFCSKALPSYNRSTVCNLNDFEELGRKLAKKCNGLPLALSVLGGYLSKNLNIEAWSDLLLSWTTMEDGKMMRDILARSYNDLPNHYLKSCFLYLAAFPEDYDIPVLELIKLWVAERFIPHTPEHKLEKTARKYVTELAQRSLVQVVGRSKVLERIEEIRIHDILRDWCIDEARQYGFLNIIDKTIGQGGGLSPDTMTSYRYSFQSSCDDNIFRAAPNLRTLVGFELSSFSLPKLRFLRVLHVECSILNNFTSVIGECIHLRYLRLRWCQGVTLPSSIGQLLYLQTIDLSDSQLDSIIPNSLWDIPTLRHVYLDSGFSAPRSVQQKELQTLYLRFCSGGRRTDARMSADGEGLPRDLSSNSSTGVVRAFLVDSPVCSEGKFGGNFVPVSGVSDRDVRSVDRVVRSLDASHRKVFEKGLCLGVSADHNKRSLAGAQSTKSNFNCCGAKIRPWRGPLPPSRRAPVVTLGDFCPPGLLPSVDRSSSTMNVDYLKEGVAAIDVDIGHQQSALQIQQHFPLLSGSLIADAVSASELNKEEITCCHFSKVDGPNSSRLALVQRAKDYGLNRIMFRRPIPRVRGLVSSVVFPSLVAARVPSYADMAARPPVGVQWRPASSQVRGEATAARRGREFVPHYHRGNVPGGRGGVFGDGRGRGDWVGRGEGRGRGDWAGRGHPYPGRGMNPGRGRAGGLDQEDPSLQRSSLQRPMYRDHHLGGLDGAAPVRDQDAHIDPAKVKKPRPPFCFRCKCVGHIQENCTEDLDCYICNKRNSHLAAKCPILKMPKPLVSMSGCAKNELCFFQIPEFDFKLEVPDPAPTALISVFGGNLDAVAVQMELAKLSRVEWNWEALRHGVDAYLVVFPSEEELLRMADIEYKLKSGITLKISQWELNGDVNLAYYLNEIWVHVTGVPHAWRHYLGFWAIGSMVGTTLEVDMLTYRKKGVIRLLVGVLDSERLPLSADIVFHKVGYDITFTPESPDFEPAVLTNSVLVANGGVDGEIKEVDAPQVRDADQSNKKFKNGSEGVNSHGPGDRLESGPMQVDGGQVGKLDNSALPGVIAVTPLGHKPFVRSAKACFLDSVKPSGSIWVTKNSPCTNRIHGQDKSVSSGTVGSKCSGQNGGRTNFVSMRPGQTGDGQNEALLFDMFDEAGDKYLAPEDVVCSAVDLLSSPIQESGIGSDGSPVGNAPEKVVCSAVDLPSSPIQESGMGSDGAPVGNSMILPGGNYGLASGNMVSVPEVEKIILPCEKSCSELNACDGTILNKAMRRTAARNLDPMIGTKTVATFKGASLSSSSSPSSQHGYFCYYPLAPFVGCVAEGGDAQYFGGGYSVFGSSGYGILLTGTWVAV